jgi:multicomponent Na+:H+ antiporter subunit G
VSAVLPWLADALVVAGLLVLTAAVAGMVRIPAFGVRLHAAAKVGSFGLLLIVLAAPVAGDGAMAARAALVLVFLLLTTPVSAHALARAAHRRRPRPDASAARRP